MDTGKGSIVFEDRRRAIRLPPGTTARSRMPMRARARTPQRHRVLLAEHNRISCRLLGRMLTRLGLEVVSLASVDEALQVFRQRPGDFSLVVLNLKSPLEGGIEWLRTWAAESDAQAVPVIALGTDPTPLAREVCIRAGARAYLTEALGDDRLSAVVRSLLTIPRARPVQEAPKAVPEAPAASPPAVPEAVGLLDEKTFRSLLELSPDPGFIEELMADFRRDGSGYFARMQTALKRRDALEWHEALHALKGSAMGLGARGLSQLCARHEDLSREALRAGQGYSEYAYILEMFNRTVQAMQSMAQEGGALPDLNSVTAGG
ncbi:response regulator [Thioalkalivibrio denitrificans]|nr:response regulator [Thioalkalivibrio denitrificans]